MAKNRGFKASKNFDPNRARAPKRTPGGARGGERGGQNRRFDERDERGYQSERRDDRAYGNKRDERGYGKQRDDRGYQGERRDDRGYRGERRDDRGYRGGRRDDRGYQSDRRDDRGYGKPRDDRGYQGDRRDDNSYRSDRRDDRGYRGERRDDRGYGSERRDDRGYRGERRDDRGYRQQRDDRGYRGERTEARRDDRPQRRFQHGDAFASRAREERDSTRGGKHDRFDRQGDSGRSSRNDRLEKRDRFESRDRFEKRDSFAKRDRFEKRDNFAKRDQFVPEEDVVLARIEAMQTSADDVAEMTFGELGLGNNIVEALAKLGAEKPFPIQGATIPDALAGKHVLGRGRTGSGKTIAFGAPLVERLLQLKAEGKFDGDPKKVSHDNRRSRRERVTGRKPKAMILAPTRELALQIDRTVQPIARSVGLYTTQIYGGVPQAKQVTALNMGVDIVIGTAGRMEDLIEQGYLDLSEVTIAVLDEADHMCDLGFLEPVQRLLRQCAPDAQKLLFSATLDREVAALVNEFLPVHAAHEVAGEDQASGTIDHQVMVVLREEKLEVLTNLVQTPGKILVFSRTRAYAEQLTEVFEDAGVPAVALHGDLNQARRTRNLKQLTSGRVNVLVATDVAARGIHVDDVDLVIQADAPDEYKTYMHRAGRTGRAGNHGTVVTIKRAWVNRRIFLFGRDSLGLLPEDSRKYLAPWSQR